MRIMVFDVPAENGGALTILEEFYYLAKDYSEEDIEWFFVLSIPNFKIAENIHVLRFPWIKRSWLHRLIFDFLIAPSLVKKYNIDKIVSLQNVTIPRTKKVQILYVHQSIPFSDVKFNILKEPILWVYKNILSKYIFKSIKQAEKVIFQTNWMKERCLQQIKVKSDKIFVSTPQISIDIEDEKYIKQGKKTMFFYPANASSYKNHAVILEACLELKKRNVDNFSITFTLVGNENKITKKILKISKERDLDVNFVGAMPREKVFDMYRKAVLLFPSYLETFGLPLLEARMVGTPILVADCLYAHEVLDGYENMTFFNWNNYNDLANSMEELINVGVGPKDSNIDKSVIHNKNLIDIILYDKEENGYENSTTN